MFFNDAATTEIYTLSLHDALPIYPGGVDDLCALRVEADADVDDHAVAHVNIALRDRADGRVDGDDRAAGEQVRSEEHTSELQSRQYLVCRLLLEIKQTLRFVLHLV